MDIPETVINLKYEESEEKILYPWTLIIYLLFYTDYVTDLVKEQITCNQRKVTDNLRVLWRIF